jgi:hypothetical protein
MRVGVGGYVELLVIIYCDWASGERGAGTNPTFGG